MRLHHAFSWRVARWPAAAVSVWLVAVAGLLFPAAASAKPPRYFETPEAAVEALQVATGSDDADALFDVLDREYEDAIIGGDKIAARVSMNEAHEAAEEFRVLRAEGDDRRILLIGRALWPLPFPIVRTEAGWYFDTAAGIEELANRRIGQNELNAIAVARAYVRAQREYAARDRDGDDVREYAMRITSRPGTRDGLYWPVEEGSGESISPFGPLVADARAYLEGREPGDPYQGYYFKVLTRQGLNPPGGRYDYVINNNMIGGFGLVAFPADYDNSGIKTFVVSHQGIVLEKDLGEDTDLIAGGMEEYNPDETWSKVED